MIMSSGPTVISLITGPESVASSGDHYHRERRDTVPWVGDIVHCYQDSQCSPGIVTEPHGGAGLTSIWILSIGGPDHYGRNGIPYVRTHAGGLGRCHGTGRNVARSIAEDLARRAGRQVRRQVGLHDGQHFGDRGDVNLIEIAVVGIVSDLDGHVETPLLERGVDGRAGELPVERPGPCLRVMRDTARRRDATQPVLEHSPATDAAAW